MTFTTETPESLGFYLSSDVRTPLPDAIAAQAELSVMGWPPSLMRQSNRLTNAQMGQPIPLSAFRAPPRRMAPTSPRLSLEEAQAQAKAAGVSDLDLYDGVRQETLNIMIERQQAKQALERKIANAGDGLGTRAALALTSLAVGVADPINIATAFVPVVPEVKYAAWLAKAGESFLARSAVRAGTGLIEGGSGAAMLEPISASLHHSIGDDYTLTESLMNIGFGGLAAGGLRSIGGAGLDLYRKVLPDRAPTIDPTVDPIGDLPIDAQRRVMIATLSQMSEGRPVELSPQVELERLTLRQAYNSVLASPMAGPPHELLASLVPDEFTRWIVQRGAAIEKNGELIVQGNLLRRIFGTRSNFGMVKFIFGHGERSSTPEPYRITQDDVLALPEVARYYLPTIDRVTERADGSDRIEREYRVERGGQVVVYATTSQADGSHAVVSIYRQQPDRTGADAPLSKRKSEGSAGSPGSLGERFKRNTQDTAAAVTSPVTRSAGEPATDYIGSRSEDFNQPAYDYISTKSEENEGQKSEQREEIDPIDFVVSNTNPRRRPRSIEWDTGNLFSWFTKERYTNNSKLQAEWVALYKTVWPTEVIDGKVRPYEVHHMIPLADGGPDHVSNIVPMSRANHQALHKVNGDFKRWSLRRWRKRWLLNP